MPDYLVSPLPDFTLGIAHGIGADAVCVCLLDHTAHVSVDATLCTRMLPLRQEALKAGRFDALDDENLDALQDVFRYGVRPGAGLGVLAEAERLLPDAQASLPPLAVFGWDDPVLATLLALAAHNLGVQVVLAFYEVPERAALVLHHAAEAPRHPGARQPRFLGRDLLDALTAQWLDRPATGADRAAAAALIARNPGPYAYWSTFSQPPSLGDVVLHARAGHSRMLVGSPTAMFSMRIRPPQATAEELALDYAECRDSHTAALGQHDAHKLALVELCKRHDFELRTIGSRLDIDGRDPRRVWPWPDEDGWVARP